MDKFDNIEKAVHYYHLIFTEYKKGKFNQYLLIQSISLNELKTSSEK